MTIAFFDFDGTLIRKDSGILCAVPAARQGLLPVSVAAQFVLARILYKLGLRTRTEAQSVGLLCYRGHTLERLREVTSGLHDSHLRCQIAPAMRERVRQHREAGDRLIILTASAHFLAEPIGRDLGFDEVHGTRVAFDAGLCTGRVEGELLDGEAKLRLAAQLAAEHGVLLSACAFYSDHVADRPLLEAVGRPFAVQPHGPLARLARERCWPILTHDLPSSPLDACNGGGEISDREVLSASRRFATAHSGLAAWQVLSTCTLVAMALVGTALPGLLGLMALPVLAGLLVRVFVLQHDCGHLSLFGSRRANDAVGSLLSVVTGVPYEAWRTEHNWHHANQGKLSHRGIDRVNSPMTREEARADPLRAKARAGLIGPVSVFVLGLYSLLISRKRPRGFFPFRPGFRWPLTNRAALVRSVWMTGVAHLLWHATLVASLGGATWAGMVLPAYLLAGGLGATLFWVQHNFERTYHASDDSWQFVDVALRGSSYVRLPQPLRFFTANIGLHHVHHLNPRIPNYRLEEARRAIPALADVAALAWYDFGRCFTHLFWDSAAHRMVNLAEALGDASSVLTSHSGAEHLNRDHEAESSDPDGAAADDGSTAHDGGAPPASRVPLRSGSDVAVVAADELPESRRRTA